MVIYYNIVFAYVELEVSFSGPSVEALDESSVLLIFVGIHLKTEDSSKLMKVAGNPVVTEI